MLGFLLVEFFNVFITIYLNR